MNQTYFGFVYLWENTHPFANKHKKYIGQHIGSTEDGYIGSGTIFVNKFYCKKYRGYWKRSILEYCTNQDQLNKAEDKFILQNNATENEEFCNLRRGGSQGKMHPSSCKKMSKAAKGRIPWNKNKPMSEASRLKMKESLKGRIPWNKGKKLRKQSKLLKEKRIKSLMASKQIEREKDYEIIIDLISEKSFLKREDLQNLFKKSTATKRLNDLIKMGKLKKIKNEKREHFYTLNKPL